MKVLTFTTLYPSVALPTHGVFVETRLRHLSLNGRVRSRVVAPVPWFFSGSPRFGKYGAFARTPREEDRFGIKVIHPRFPLIPKVGMTVAPVLLAVAAEPALRRVIRDGFDFDLIDAHYFYPDGVAAVALGRRLRKPVVVTARGTDVNLIPRYRLPRKMILWAARNASGVVAVCGALRDALAGLGVPRDRIQVLRNGVDLELFSPVDRGAERARLGFKGPTLLSVGHLVPRKGHDVVIRSLSLLPDARLCIVGDGPQGRALRRLARELGVEDRVTFTGAVPQYRLRGYYCGADVLVLASSREGWANVLLEAMACGTPVVATNVWGTPEVLAAPEAGVLVERRTPEAIADAVRTLLAAPPDRSATRRYAEGFSWDSTTAGQLALFERILRG